MGLSNKGFTLIEVLVAAFVLIVGICSMLSLFTFSMASSQSGWDRTVATSHAQGILEAMENIPTLSEIVLKDWEQWAEDRHLRVLPQERFKVTYTNPNTNPLDIQVLVQWERRQRTNAITLATQLTK